MGSCPPFKTLKLINRHPQPHYHRERHPKINASAIKQYSSATLSVDKTNILKKINPLIQISGLGKLLEGVITSKKTLVIGKI